MEDYMSFFSQMKLLFQNDITKAFSLVSPQNPLPVDGDSVYKKDVWVEECVTTDWTDVDGTGENVAEIPFTNLHTHITNATTDNPKVLLIHLNRTVSINQVGLGCYDSGDFSNVKIEVLGSGDEVRAINDESASATKYTSRDYALTPVLGNAIRFTFATADAVTLSNITIQKVHRSVSRLQAIDSSGVTIDISGSTGQNGSNLDVSLDQVERTTNSVKTITYAHAALHDGEHYSIKGTEELVKNTSKEILIVTPNTTKWAHTTIQVESLDSAVVVTLFEGTTTSADGTGITARNRNRNVADDNTTLYYAAPTITDDGTAIYTYRLGSGKTVGGGARDSEEIVLKQNTKYLLRITEPNVANTNINWVFDWYEHTNLG
jgi:hypothetical protein